MAERFIPDWAERTLQRPTPFDIAMFSALEDFFQAWERLHNLPNDRLHRRQAENAAQELVDKAHLLRRMRADRPINGSKQ